MPRDRPASQYRFDLRGGLFLHVREHVRINIERKRRAGTPKLLRDHLRRNACRQGEGRTRVPEVIEPDYGQASLFQN